jgi:hypothetical protein
LVDSEQESIERITKLAEQITSYLDWELRPDGAKVMPPRLSGQYKKLAKPENAAKRQELLVIARKLLSP